MIGHEERKAERGRSEGDRTGEGARRVVVSARIDVFARFGFSAHGMTWEDTARPSARPSLSRLVSCAIVVIISITKYCYCRHCLCLKYECVDEFT